MKRRWIVSMLLLGIVLGTLTGCSGANTRKDTGDPVSVVVWHYYSGRVKETFDNLVSRFNETVGLEKGIVVTAESKGGVNDLANAVIDAAEQKVGAEEMPTVFATYMDTAYTLYNMDMLANLAPYFTQEELDQFIPSFLEEGRIRDGELQVLPVAKSTELLYLNETDWQSFADATGATLEDLSTWEGLAKVSETYYNWSGGKAFFGRDAFPNYLIVGSRQLGKEIFAVKDGKAEIQLDEAVMRRLWDNYAAPYLKGYYAAYGRFRSDDVKTGDLIAFVGSTSSIAYFPTEVTMENGSSYSIKGLPCMLPNFEGTQAFDVQQGAGMAVAKSDEKTETAAVEFLKWLTAKEQNIDFSVGSGYCPVMKLDDSEQVMSDALIASGVEKGSLPFENGLLSMKTIQTSTLYTSKPFDGGFDARNTLEEFMTAKLDSYRPQLEGLSANELDQALDALFQSWLADLNSALQG